jgi:catechol-2,3-dioxygenase
MEIIEIELQTYNIVETESFYKDIFGLPLITKKENELSFKVGKSTLTFKKTTNLNPKYHFAFNIPNNKIDEAISWASSRFKLIENDENGVIANFETWNAKAIYFYDNNFNILEFIARFDLENSSDKKFDISSVLSISELGIVVDEPLKLAENLVETYQLDYFEKSNKSDSFVGVGNDNGLMIIVKKNRKWFPTDQEAEKHIARIKILSNGQINEINFNQEENQQVKAVCQ